MSAIRLNTPTDPSGTIKVVELHMMDKWHYYPLTATMGFTIRGILYPFSLIKTRLQIQRKSSLYHGTFDAFCKIYKLEGFSGLYRGFWLSNLLITSQMAYITTYENTRHLLTHYIGINDTKKKSLIAGFCASVAGQTFLVPIDIITQHLMMSGIRSSTTQSKSDKLRSSLIDIPKYATLTRWGPTRYIVREIFKSDGLKGFYKGYFISLATYAPNSALWWFFYDIYCGCFIPIAPVWMPRLVVQCVAAPLGGITSSIITNPIDTVRARMQVSRIKFLPCVKRLWAQEGIHIFTKGLSARLIMTTIFSFNIILGYETIKHWSLLDEYKDEVRW